MQLTIDDFKCTILGRESIVNKNMILSSDENKIIKTIYEYELATDNDVENERIWELELIFNNLYRNLDLTRLVAMRYLSICKPESIIKRTNEDNPSNNSNINQTFSSKSNFNNKTFEYKRSKNGVQTDDQRQTENKRAEEEQTDNSAQGYQQEDESIDAALRFVAGTYLDAN